MRRNVSWKAKAVYLIFALALVMGLVPALAAATLASAGYSWCDFVASPQYAKVGQVVTFVGAASSPPDNWLWTFGDASATASGQMVSHMYTNTGEYTVTLTCNWGTVSQSASHTIKVGEGLIPQEAWNVVGAQETFSVPEAYRGHVWLWRFMPALGLDGGWSVIRGGNVDGPPQENGVVVQGTNVGELVIVADTNLDLDKDGANDSLYGVKKWGKINETLISDPGSTEVVWCEDLKEFVGRTTIYEMVIGTFNGDPEEFEFEMPANGADVEWWLLNADAPVHDLPM